MSLDLSNVRLAAAFLSKTEIKFDMVSAVDELAAQVQAAIAQTCLGGVWHCLPPNVHSAVEAEQCPPRLLLFQIRLEFDFCREARIMDAVARQFQVFDVPT